MYLRKVGFLAGLFISILSLSLCFSSAAQAEEKAAPAVEEPYSGKQDQKWEEVQNNLAAAKTKLDAQATLLSTLIADKAHLSGDALVARIEEIKAQHKKYEQMASDYNKQNDDYLTKYPERGVKEKRIYRRIKIKSLESFEDDISLRGRMNKLHNKVLKQYQRAKKQQSSPGQTEGTTKNSTDTPPGNGKKAPDVTETINLQK